MSTIKTHRKIKELRLQDAVEFLDSNEVIYETLTKVHFRIYHPKGLRYIDFSPITGLWLVHDLPVISYDTHTFEGLKEYLSDMEYY